MRKNDRNTIGYGYCHIGLFSAYPPDGVVLCQAKSISLSACDVLATHQQLLTVPILCGPLWQVVFWEDHSSRLGEAPSELAEQAGNFLGERERDH